MAVEKKIIEPAAAVKAAADYFAQVVMPIDASTQLSLESLELSANKVNWLVTFSHRDPTAPSIYSLYPGTSNKIYKLFTINAETGEINSMKATKI